jgi:ATP-binding cassette subfamily F protein uup
LSKRYGVAPLFRNISFTVSEGERIGLIGPNGSGKSTLLEMLAGRVAPDAGEVALRKRARLALVAQVSEFTPAETVRSVIEKAMQEGGVREPERAARFAEVLGRAGFDDPEASARSLSGGWRKRLAIAAGLVQQPDILLLDEPTNHLDLEGIEWLESVLAAAPLAYVVVSHDRYFLENVTNAMVEISRMYEDGFLRVAGNYSRFLEAKENYLHAQQKRQDALENRVHVELEWLRRGPKARTTKAKARIDKAGELIGELAELSSRTRSAAARIDFSATERQTFDTRLAAEPCLSKYSSASGTARGSVWSARTAAAKAPCSGFCRAKSSRPAVRFGKRRTFVSYTLTRIAAWSPRCS